MGISQQKNETVINPVYQAAGNFVDGVAAVFPIRKEVWLEDSDAKIMRGADFILWSVNYIDTAGQTLYESNRIMKDAQWKDFADLGSNYRYSEKWRIYDFTGQPIVEQDINGLYGETEQGTYYVWDHVPFWWGEFQDEPIYEVVEWNESIPYKDYTSAELVEFAHIFQ